MGVGPGRRFEPTTTYCAFICARAPIMHLAYSGLQDLEITGSGAHACVFRGHRGGCPSVDMNECLPLVSGPLHHCWNYWEKLPHCMWHLTVGSASAAPEPAIAAGSPQGQIGNVWGSRGQYIPIAQWCPRSPARSLAGARLGAGMGVLLMTAIHGFRATPFRRHGSPIFRACM